MEFKSATVLSVINDINSGLYLPEIQRPLVWETKQIEKLFDSLFLDYPIGTMLFWKPTKSVINQREQGIILREFINNFHEKNNCRNNIVSLPLTCQGEPRLVLDGQQRLSALYIALKGTLARRLSRHSPNKEGSYPQKELFCDISIPFPTGVKVSAKTRFLFLTDAESREKDGTWFKVKDVLAYLDQSEFKRWLDQQPFDSVCASNLNRLYEMLVVEKALSYFEIENQYYDDAEEIFVRLNTGGTPLSEADLMCAAIVKHWGGFRAEMEKSIHAINEDSRRFSIDRNFMIRACLMLLGKPLNMKVQDIEANFVDELRAQWGLIIETLEDSFGLLKEWGFEDERIMSYNAMLPIAYYLYKKGQKGAENEKEMRAFFINAQLKKLFGASTSSVLASIRANAFPNSSDYRRIPFTLKMFGTVHFQGGRTPFVTADDIDGFLELEKGPYTFMLLSLLYPNVRLNNAVFHQDHLHPYSGFTTAKIKKALAGSGDIDLQKEAKCWKALRNKLANLQLLQGPENESKNAKPLKGWVEEGNDFKFRPGNVSLEFKDFPAFYSERQKQIKEELKRIFGIPDEDSQSN